MEHSINEFEAEAAASPPAEWGHDVPLRSSGDDGNDGFVPLDDPYWDAELLKRITEVRNGTAITFSAEEVMAEAKRRYG